MPDAEKVGPARCEEHFDRHPDLPHLVAVCALPAGHDGEHSNILPKPVKKGCTCGPNGTPVECAAEVAAGGWCPNRHRLTRDIPPGSRDTDA